MFEVLGTVDETNLSDGATAHVGAGRPLACHLLNLAVEASIPWMHRHLHSFHNMSDTVEPQGTGYPLIKTERHEIHQAPLSPCCDHCAPTLHLF